MSEQMVTEYKGMQIEFQEWEDAFVVTQDGYKNQSLKKCKERIDRITKEDFERVNVIVLGGGRKREANASAQVTSVEYEGRHVSAWVIDKNKKRSKESLSDLILDTPEARADLKRVATLRAQAEKIEEEASAIEKAIPRYKPTIKDKAET